MYDFQTVLQRRDSNSVKWDVSQQEIPLNLADMDFATAPEIITALQKKVATGVFGYEEIPMTYYQAIANWYEQEHGCRPETDWLLFVNGVVPALSSLVRRLSHPGDNIVVQPPVYNIFYNSIENNGRHTLANNLIYQVDHYEINFSLLKQQLAQPLTTIMILCNPQNPSGQIWSYEQLKKIVNLCQQFHVILISDEIHGDLTLNSNQYTPIFSLPDVLIQSTIALISPSKTFNLAALHAASVIVPNEALRQQVIRSLNNDELAEPNLAAVPGTIAAYTKGQPWLNALKHQLQDNYQLVSDYLQRNLPEVRIIYGGASYLLWLDFHAFKIPASKLVEQLQENVGLLLSDGSLYRGNGADFLRLNMACPPAVLKVALQRLIQGLLQIVSHK